MSLTPKNDIYYTIRVSHTHDGRSYKSTMKYCVFKDGKWYHRRYYSAQEESGERMQAAGPDDLGYEYEEVKGVTVESFTPETKQGGEDDQ